MHHGGPIIVFLTWPRKATFLLAYHPQLPAHDCNFVAANLFGSIEHVHASHRFPWFQGRWKKKAWLLPVNQGIVHLKSNLIT